MSLSRHGSLRCLPAGVKEIVVRTGNHSLVGRFEMRCYESVCVLQQCQSPALLSAAPNAKDEEFRGCVERIRRRVDLLAPGRVVLVEEGDGASEIEFELTAKIGRASLDPQAS